MMRSRSSLNSESKMQQPCSRVNTIADQVASVQV